MNALLPSALPRIGYRPIPANFRETFARVGWDGIEAECHAHKRTITRWIAVLDAEAEQAGRPMCWQLRRAVVEAQAAAQGKRVRGRRPGQRARRYVLGRTLTQHADEQP